MHSLPENLSVVPSSHVGHLTTASGAHAVMTPHSDAFHCAYATTQSRSRATALLHGSFELALLFMTTG